MKVDVQKNLKMDEIFAAFMVVGFFVLFHTVGIGCPIKFATGISCPGCGMTRAWLYAITLRLDLAFAYHPLFWTVPPLFLIAALRQRLNARVVRAVFIAALVAFLTVWVLRLISPNDADVLSCGHVHDDVVSIETPGWYQVFATATTPRL